MPCLFLPREKIDTWAALLANQFEVLFPSVVQENVHFCRYPASQLKSHASGLTWGLDRIRASESVKAFFFPPRETVATFPGPESPPTEDRRLMIIGVKNCDLAGLQLHRRVFLGGELGTSQTPRIDPFFKGRLDRTVIVTADCPRPEDTCFCNLLGLTPYVEAGSDINFTALDSGYLVEPMSAAGNELVFGRDKPFRPATEAEVKARETLRHEALAALRKTNQTPLPDDLPQRVEQARAEQFWSRAGQGCVECYACLTNCPTCFCYLLYDQAKPAAASEDLASVQSPTFDRVRIWDACYSQGYARVAGGANARPRVWERFRNRFHCKWMNCTRSWGVHSCTGCGRCLTSCPARIDIRKILSDL